MNEILSLSTNVMHLLSNELKGVGIVALLGNGLLIKISRADFENSLGNLLQQIQSVIDQRFPVREEHLSIVIQDNEKKYENVFKIWKSA